jgi:hypothetical protein
MFRLIPAALGCIVCLAMTSVADAQLVRVGSFGGVSVRVPFVSVDVLPYGGGTRVRAPFTSVNTGAYRYGYGYPAGYVPYPATVPVYPAPVYPAPVYSAPLFPEAGYVNPEPNVYQSVRRASSDSLPDRLIASAQQLKRSLSLRGDDSDIWLDYLGPDRIIANIDRGESPGSLRTVLINYDGVVGNPDLSSISRASGFRQTHQLLRDFVDRPSAASDTPMELPLSNGDSILVPDAETKGPTPAPVAKPADKGRAEVENEAGVEELPLPPPL